MGRDSTNGPQPASSIKNTAPDLADWLDSGTIAGLLLALLVITVIIYSGSLHNAFLEWDDRPYILENAAIQKLDWPHIKTIFSSFSMGNYHPVTSLTYALEYSVAGDRSTFLYHADNLLLHLVNIVLVFLVFARLAGKQSIGLLVAALFAVHPLRVESVVWIAERKDVLYACFFLLSLLMYLLYGKRQGYADASGQPAAHANTFLHLSLFFFLLALLSKSAAVVLPLILLLVDFLWRRKIDRRAIVEKLPFFALALLFGVVALTSQSAAQAMPDLSGCSFFERLLLVNHSVVRYLYLAFVPAPLSALHPYPKIIGKPLPFVYFLSPFITLTLAGGLVYAAKTGRRIILFGSLFFLVSIALVLQIVPVGVAIISERYTYIPHLGLFFIICTWLDKLLCRGTIRGISTKWLVAGLAGTFLLVFTVMTEVRSQVWREAFTLWDDVVRKYPATAYSAYYDRGKALHDKQQLEAAFADYCRVITMKPDYYKAYTNRGLIYQERKDYPAALEDYRRAIAINPGYYIVYNNRGVLNKDRGDFDAAISDFNKALALKADCREALYNRGTLFYSQKEFGKALQDFNRSMALGPNFLKSYSFRGLTRFSLGDKTGACEDWRAGVSLGDPNCKEDFDRHCH